MVVLILSKFRLNMMMTLLGTLLVRFKTSRSETDPGEDKDDTNEMRV